MSVFGFVGTVTNGLLGQHHTTAELWFDGTHLVVQHNLGGGTTRLSLADGGLVDVVSQTETTTSDLEDVRWFSGETRALSQADIASVVNAAGSQSLTLFADRSGQFSDAIEALSITIGSQTYILLAEPAGGGLAAYRYEAGGLTRTDAKWDQADSYMQGVAAMTTATLGGTTFVVVAGANDNGVAVLQLSANGKLTPISAMGYDEFLPVYTVTSVDAVTMGGRSFILVTAADTSSLTVLELSADGGLTAIDQVMDEAPTRFQGAMVLETFAHGDQTYILVSGQDDGLSLFTLLPDGHLVHVESLADTNSASLSNISNIKVVEFAGVFQVFVTSAQDHGVTQLTLDLGTPGVVRDGDGNLTGTGRRDILAAGGGGVALSGGSGDDILRDGTGQDTLTGGNGADIFILGADSHQDRILDFNPDLDRLDLSAWGYLRDVGQLSIQSRSYGATITFGGHSLRVETHDGSSLDADDFTTAMVLNATHVNLSYVGDPYLFPEEEVEGSNGSDTIEGGDGDQILSGGDDADTLTGGEGADQLLGGDGVDMASYADAGSGVTANLGAPEHNTGEAEGDTFTSIEGVIGSAYGDDLTGDASANVLDGGSGDDVLRGLDGADALFGQDGVDWIDGGLGNDSLEGGDGNDALLGRSGNDTILGGDGNDNIAAHEGNDVVYGGAGDDLLGGSFGDDLMYGGTGNDVIGSGAQNDLIDAGDGHDVASGGWGVDEVFGGAGNDTLAGSYGTDTVRGEDGDDSIGGGQGDDILYGGSGNDLLGAGDDNDTLYGGTGNDFLGGGAGDDQMFGGEGNDTFNSGTGNDTMTGAAGSDIFVFNSFTAGEVDIITDFTIGQDALRMKYVTGRFDGLGIEDVTLNGMDYAQITYDGHRIRLRDVEADDISASDFIFLG